MSKGDNSLDIQKTVKGNLPRLPLLDIKNYILGKEYNLSIIFVGDKRSLSLNKKFRGKEYIPNVLSFSYDRKNGEIFLNPHQARREAPKYDRDYKNFVAYLVIHALFHLKGMDHGSRMENKEREVRIKFGFDN